MNKHYNKCDAVPSALSVTPSAMAAMHSLDLGTIDGSQENFQADQLVLAESLEGSAIYVFDSAAELL